MSVAPVRAETSANFAASASTKLEAALKSLRTAQSSSARLKALDTTIRGYETGLTAIRARLRSLAKQEHALKQHLKDQRAKINQLLGILQSIEHTSKPTFMLHPLGPIGAAHSGLLIAEAVPVLQNQTENLTQQLNALKTFQTAQEESQIKLQNGLIKLQKNRTTLSKAISDRTDLPEKFASNPANLDRIEEDRQDLDILANTLPYSSNVALQNDPNPFTNAKGTLPLPTRGTVLRSFKEADATGVRRPGIILGVPPVALINAPTLATVRFTGAVLNYDNVVILEPEPDILLILAGLQTVYVVSGQIVKSGDPLGIMGGSSLDLQDFLTKPSELTGANTQESLYIELRQKGKPVDPIDWFAFRNI